MPKHLATEQCLERLCEDKPNKTPVSLKNERRVRFNRNVSYIDHATWWHVRDETKPSEMGRWTVDVATVDIIDRLQNDRTRREAHAKAVDTFRVLTSSASASNKAIKTAFRMLDTALFFGKLHRNTSLLVVDRAPTCDSGVTFAPGSKYAARTAIVLGRCELISHPIHIRSGVVLLTLIHQMIHAYFLTRCEKQRTGLHADERLKHGHHFWAVYFAIMDIIDGYDVACREPPVGDSTGVLQWAEEFAFGCRGCSWLEKHEFNHTDCSTATMQFFSRDQVHSWLNAVRCRARNCTGKYLSIFDLETGHITKIERYERENLLDYCEVVWRKHSFRLATTTMTKKYPSLANNWLPGSRCVFYIPNYFDSPTVKRFLSFLKIGDYKPFCECFKAFTGPNPNPVVTAKDCNAIRPSGALLADIKAYNLAAHVGFTEMQLHVMRRLQSDGMIVTDPLPIISEIYPCHSGSQKSNQAPAKFSSVPQPLRDWAKDFMMNTLLEDKSYFSSNMAIMEYLAPVPGLYGLVLSSTSPELALDYQIARLSLWRRTPEEEKPKRGMWSADGPQISPVPRNPAVLTSLELLSIIPPPPELPYGEQWHGWATYRFSAYRRMWDKRNITLEFLERALSRGIFQSIRELQSST